MTKRGSLVAAAAVLALAGGLFALRLPVFIDAYDQFGWQVKCGSGFTTDLIQASSADQAVGAPSSNYVGQCSTALMMRRLWAIPLAALGGLALTALTTSALAHDRRKIST